MTIPAHGSLWLDTRSAALRVAITAAADWAVSLTTTEVVGACARCAAAVPEFRRSAREGAKSLATMPSTSCCAEPPPA